MEIEKVQLTVNCAFSSDRGTLEFTSSKLMFAIRQFNHYLGWLAIYYNGLPVWLSGERVLTHDLVVVHLIPG